MVKENSRRKFLKQGAKTSVALAVGGATLVGCGNSAGLQTSKSKVGKEEILYRGDTRYWKTYYANAK